MDYRYYESSMMNLKKEMKKSQPFKKRPKCKNSLIRKRVFRRNLIPRNLTLVMAYLVSNIVYGEK